MLTTILSIWGAVVATTLGAIRVWEFRRDRTRIFVSYSLAAPEYGNEIILENVSGRPVMVSYWELCRMKRGKPFWRWETTSGRFPNEGYCRITITPYSRHTLEFKGPDWFDWGRGSEDKGSWYLKLYILGRRPMWLKVYG